LSVASTARTHHTQLAWTAFQIFLALRLFCGAGITALRPVGATVVRTLRAQHDPGGRIAARERAGDRQYPKENAPTACALCRPILLH
jgi:hypothetical protein